MQNEKDDTSARNYHKIQQNTSSTFHQVFQQLKQKFNQGNQEQSLSINIQDQCIHDDYLAPLRTQITK